MSKTDEQLQRDAHHASEALANPVLKEVLKEMEVEALNALATVDPFDGPLVSVAQADLSSVRGMYERLVKRVRAYKNKQFADEKRQDSPMGETLSEPMGEKS